MPDSRSGHRNMSSWCHVARAAGADWGPGPARPGRTMSFRRASLHKPGWNSELRQGLNNLNREFHSLDSNAENYTGSDPPPIWRRDVVVHGGAKHLRSPKSPGHASYLAQCLFSKPTHQEFGSRQRFRWRPQHDDIVCSITGEHGGDVRLKKSAHVGVAVTAEPIICSRTS
jgi:hypothetical protein